MVKISVKQLYKVKTFLKRTHCNYCFVYLPCMSLVLRHSHSNFFILPSETKTFIQQNFLLRTIRQWNNLPAAMAAAPSLETFKRGVALLVPTQDLDTDH